MTEPLALPEVADEVYHTKLHPNISDLLTARVLVLADFGFEFPQHYGILSLEACQGLLLVQKVTQGGGREVCTNDQGLFPTGTDLSYHHVRIIETHGLYAPSL